MTSPIFIAENLTTERIDHMSFHLNPNEIVAMIGPSGSGKSSLLFAVNRLEPLKEGTLTFRGHAYTYYAITEWRKRIGLVLQEPYLFEGSIADNICYGPSLFQEPCDVNDLLDRVQLPRSYGDRTPDTLSGGEKQRINLARTLANEPDILLLDEVTASLDRPSTEAIEALLKEYVKQTEKAIVLVTHDLDQAKRLSDRTVFIQEGHIEEEGETTSLFTSPQSEALQRFLKEKLS